jgi:hypothetical protein
VTASVRAIGQRLRDARTSLRTLRTAGMVVGLRLDKYLRMGAAARYEGFANTVGIAMSALLASTADTPRGGGNCPSSREFVHDSLCQALATLSSRCSSSNILF